MKTDRRGKYLTGCWPENQCKDKSTGKDKPTGNDCTTPDLKEYDGPDY